MNTRDILLYLLCVAIVIALAHLVYIEIKGRSSKKALNGNSVTASYKDLKISVVLRWASYNYIENIDEIGIIKNFKTNGCIVYSSQGSEIGRVVKLSLLRGGVKVVIVLSPIPYSRVILESILNRRAFFTPKLTFSDQVPGKPILCIGIHSLVLVTTPVAFHDTEIHSL